MDESRFDNLTRGVASARSRRTLLKSVLGLIAGGALASRAGVAEAVSCRGGGDTCSRSNQCCSGVCDTSNPDRALRNRCTCAAGQANCRNQCVDVMNDVDNCGACGNVCPKVSDNQCMGEAICAQGACGFVPLEAGTWCDDGNACTQNDTCNGQGGCIGGEPVECNSGNPCAIDSCDPAVGCVQEFKLEGTSCDDGNPCNGNEVCDGAGHCMQGTPVICQPSDQCHAAGVCDPSTGQCSNPPKTDGTPCNDGNSCTGNDVCRQGVCSGTMPDFYNDVNNCGGCGRTCYGAANMSCQYASCCGDTQAGRVCCDFPRVPAAYGNSCYPYQCNCYTYSYKCGAFNSDTCYQTVCDTCYNTCYYPYCA